MTPIVKASKGRQAIAFFTLKEYENWREEQGAAASGWQIKYYKGLGTSTSVEANISLCLRASPCISVEPS